MILCGGSDSGEAGRHSLHTSPPDRLDDLTSVFVFLKMYIYTYISKAFDSHPPPRGEGTMERSRAVYQLLA